MGKGDRSSVVLRVKVWTEPMARHAGEIFGTEHEFAGQKPVVLQEIRYSLLRGAHAARKGALRLRGGDCVAERLMCKSGIHNRQLQKTTRSHKHFVSLRLQKSL
jgi:hypothetical protein